MADRNFQEISILSSHVATATSSASASAETGRLLPESADPCEGAEAPARCSHATVESDPQDCQGDGCKQSGSSQHQMHQDSVSAPRGRCCCFAGTFCTPSSRPRGGTRAATAGPNPAQPAPRTAHHTETPALTLPTASLLSAGGTLEAACIPRLKMCESQIRGVWRGCHDQEHSQHYRITRRPRNQTLFPTLPSAAAAVRQLVAVRQPAAAVRATAA